MIWRREEKVNGNHICFGCKVTVILNLAFANDGFYSWRGGAKYVLVTFESLHNMPLEALKVLTA